MATLDPKKQRRGDPPPMLRAEKLVELRIADSADSWSLAGFRIERCAAIPHLPPFVQLGHVSVFLLGPSAGYKGKRGILAWGFDSSPAHTGEFGFTIDSLATVLISGRDEDRLEFLEYVRKLRKEADESPNGSIHPNGAVGIDHIVILSPNFKKTIGMMAMVSVHPRKMTQVRGTKMCFFRSGDVVIELVDIGSNDATMNDNNSTRSQDGNQIGATAAAAADNANVADGGAQFWGLTLLTRDLDATASYLGPNLARTIRPAVQGKGRRIFTLNHKAVGISVNTAFIDRALETSVATDSKL
ncbi:hypothetical protein HDV05_006523 [Chytridiales sp. JEL 0842]|nr:hypothetical protein HDV05_006523 [Chytridiales sp. JEL 0842]